VPLSKLIQSRRVILVVGCGGVGKTTTTAALGLAAAMAGKRVLCLTIDPAKRLAQSLGLPEMTGEAKEVEPARFEAAGFRVPGSLTVMMLDTKRTFDELVIKYASSPEARDRIFANKLYQYLSTSLAGTQEYMAMEKLHAIKDDPNYDLILLDTPPTANALDFLDAPERMVDILDSAVMRWIVSAVQSSGKLSLNLLTKSTAIVLKGIGRLTGGGFLQDLAQFLGELNDLFGGFKERAREVSAGLRAPDVAYVLVTSPEPMSIQEVLYFSDRLREQNMPRDAFVVNRVHPTSAPTKDVTVVERALARLGIALEPGGAERVVRAALDEASRGELDAKELEVLDQALADSSDRPIRVDVPAFAKDVHDIEALAKVAGILVERAA